MTDGIFPPDPSPNAPSSQLDRDFLHRQIDAVVGITRERIIPDLEPDGDIASIGFLIDRDGGLAGTVMLVALPDVSSQQIEAGFRQFLRDQKAAGYIVQFMGWLARNEGTTEQEMERLKSGTFVPPSQRPDRVEVLTIVAGSFDATACRVYETVRDEGCRIVRLEERAEMRDRMVRDGLFGNLLRRE
jgi:hypothetical protein